MPRPSRKIKPERLDRSGAALGPDLDSAVFEIPDVTANLMGGGRSLGKKSIANALHVATY